VLQLEELKSRKRVLRRLGFATADDVVEMKGRVACEISSGDELLLTEMMFGGVFGGLTPEQCAALLSCFVFQEKVRAVLKRRRLGAEAVQRISYSYTLILQSEAKVRLKEDLANPLRILQETARRIAKVSTESGIALVEEEYVQTFKVEMMDVVMQWCKGTKFADICKVGRGGRVR
jgi:ATP-dependent RNA helicase DOB1